MSRLRPVLLNAAFLLPALLICISAGAAAEAGFDPTAHYALDTAGSTRQLAPGETGRFVLHLKPGKGAYVSPDTPFSLVFEGEGVTFEKTRWALADAVSGGPEKGRDRVTPRFEVPFELGKTGKGKVEATLTFFLCTKGQCIRQMRRLELDVRAR